MIYKSFKDKKLSALGMGCMRLPTVGGKDGEIDVERTAEMVDYALRNGVNYFDTAWGYHNGNSEPVMGKVLEKYPRESFFLATKFPGYSMDNMGKAAEIFQKQLERCRVDYFDFYLVHTVCESNIEQYLDKEKYGDIDYLIKLRNQGKIKHLGFSTHADTNTLNRFLKAYGKEMEFCQIQLNYLDWSMQNAKAQVEAVRKFGLPVWVMEPVRGGKLANLDEKYAEILKALRPDEKIPAWAFRFIQSIPDVAVTLSGMSNFDQLKENIETFSTDKPLSTHEWHTVLKIADSMQEKKALPCTSCRYCTAYCPQRIDIPRIIELYNEHCFSEGNIIASSTVATFDESKTPSDCIGCRNCEEVCPQKIRISEAMSDFASRL